MPTIKAPAQIPQHVYDEIIGYAHDIAMRQRGTEELKDATELRSDLNGELEELDQDIDRIDAYLEASDVLYKCLCLHEVTDGKSRALRTSLVVIAEIFQAGFNEDFDIGKALSVMLAKYARRATGAPKNNDAERALVASLL